jgi:hypothetical protein
LNGYMEQYLFGNYTKKIFWACMRLGYDTFNFLINIIAPSLQKQDIHMRDCILVEKHVALSLACLDSGNSLMSC